MGLSLLGSGIVLLPKDGSLWTRQLALLTMMGCLIITFLLFTQFDLAQIGPQFQENYLLLKTWNIRYAVGIDGLSLSFILLTLNINWIIILFSWNRSFLLRGQYLTHFFLIQTFLIGSFAAIDAIFFYICWEAVLIVALLSIRRWGSQRRAYASTKFFLYSFFGSASLLIAYLYLGSFKGCYDFSISHFYTLKLNRIEQILIFCAFLIGFTIKIPLWPLHTWLAYAHTEASTEGSIVLSALILKLGGYGLLRFCLPIVPDATRELAPFACIFSLITIFYAGLITLIQSDMKRLLAYSSISHMGMVTLGVFLAALPSIPNKTNLLFKNFALQGATIQMISHALNTTGLLLTVGILYQRFHSRKIADYRGLANITPLLTGYFLLFILSTLALPGTAGFVGKFLIILGAMHSHWSIAILTSMTLLLSAGYALVFYTKLAWGRPKNRLVNTTISLHLSEKLSLLLIAVQILSIGLWPNPYLQVLQPSLENILQLSLQSKL
jgi:NADH-quinone oxidoreductase subunit M